MFKLLIFILVVIAIAMFLFVKHPIPEYKGAEVEQAPSNFYEFMNNMENK